MKKLPFLFLILFFSQAQADYKKIFKQQAFVDQFVSESVKHFDGKEIKTIKAYSKLIKEELFPYSDAYTLLDVGAKRHKLYFEGVTVTGFNIPNKRFFLEKVEITTPTYKLSNGIKVGSTNKELIKYFKFSGIIKGHDITYTGESETVTFYFKNGVINKIVFYLYTG